MNLLLDTHTFLWFITDYPALSGRAKSLIEDTHNGIYLSIASIWEMSIKISLGKLNMPSPFSDFIDQQLSQNQIDLLQLTIAHTGVVATLPFHHRDPFDRILIAQSLHEGMPIIGEDSVFDAYGVERIW